MIKDIEEYRKGLIRNEIADCIGEFLSNQYRVESKRLTGEIIDEYVAKIYEISNADFTDNANPHHREEQPF